MKLSILFFNLFLLISFPLIAQELNCGTVISDESYSELLKVANNPEYMRTRSTTNNIQRYGIKHHIVRNTNGTGGLNGAEIAQIVQSLNSAFSAANIQFYTYGSINYINNSTYANFVEGDHEEVLIAQYNEQNAINIYYFPSASTGGASVAGYTYTQDLITRKNFICIVNQYATNNSTVIHEMGHYFNLLHTHDKRRGSEHPNGSNCATAGDLCCDTPADPGLNSTNVVNCQYVGNATMDGVRYKPDVSNFMCYAPVKSCRTQFSNQQYQRMYATSRSSRPPHSGDLVLDYVLNVPNNAKLNYTSITIKSGGHLNVTGGEVTTNSLTVENGGRLTTTRTTTGVLKYKTLNAVSGSVINLAGTFISN